MVTGFGVEFARGGGRSLVGRAAAFADEEVGPPEEGFSGLIEVVLLVLVLVVVVVDVLQDPAILQKGRSCGLLVVLAEDAALAFRNVQHIRFVVEVWEGLSDQFKLVPSPLLLPEVIYFVSFQGFR